MKKPKADRWTSSGFNTALKCSVKGCSHTAPIITKAHLRIERGLTREEAVEKFGYPIEIQNRGMIANENDSNRWNSIAKASDL